MKLQRTRCGNNCRITFVAETEEEQLILSGLRSHFFYGTHREGTYPEYDGMATDKTHKYVDEVYIAYKLFRGL